MIDPGIYEKDWNPYASTVHDRKSSADWSGPRLVRTSHFDEFFDVRPGDRILDAGCGHGEYTQWALERGAHVSAFDYAPEMVASTHRRLKDAGLAAEDLRVADVTAIPHPDESFDAVFCLAVLDHLSEAEAARAVRELVRVAKPGARVYLNVPMRRAYWWRAGHKLMQLLGLFPPGRTRWYTPEELRLLALGAGLESSASLGLWAIPPLSGIYTTDIRRFTFLPKRIANWLDRVHLRLEKRLRRSRRFQPYCLHYFLETRKPAAVPPTR